jgi:hypothetical protein
VPNRPLRSSSISSGSRKAVLAGGGRLDPTGSPAWWLSSPCYRGRGRGATPAHLVAVRLNEARRRARGEHRPSPARSSGIQRALHVVVMGLGGGVRWRSTQVPDTRLPRRCRAWRARFSRTEPNSRGTALLCRAAPGRSGVRMPHPRPGAGLRTSGSPRSSAVTGSDQQGVARCPT